MLGTAVGAIFVAWGAVIGAGRLSDNSFFTHLATGRLILDGGVPTADPYSFSAPGEPWVVQSWLASLLYGVVDELAGGLGLRLLTAVVAAALAACTWRLTRPAGTLIGRALIAVPVLAVGSTFWSPRPLLLGLLALALTLLVVTEERDPRWLIPIFAAWANAHGSWPLGLVAIGALWLGRRADGEAGTAELRALVWAAGTAVVAGIANPIGPKLLLFPVTLLGRSDVLDAMVEWQSPSFDRTYARVFLLQVVIAVLALVRRPSYRAAIPLVVFAAAALLGLRNIPVASLAIVPGMALGLAELGTVDGRRRDPAAVVVLGAATVVGVLGLVGVLSRDDYDLRAYPVGSVSWAVDNGLAGSGEARLVSEEWVGNLLELELGEGANVFFDDRVDMYPDDVVADFLAIDGGGAGALEALDRWEVDAVLWREDAALSALLLAGGEWRPVHVEETPEAGTWLVLCRRGSSACEPLATIER